jgi:phosphoenolpyruvate synthase/pyruvate phosphate dikinase
MTEKQLLKFFQENEIDIQSARACFLAIDFYFKAYADSNLFKHSLSPAFGYAKTFDDKSVFYELIPKKVLHDFCQEIYREYLKAPRKLIGKIKTRDDIHRKIETLWDKYNKADQNNLKDISTFIRKLILSMKKWISYAAIGEDKWQIIEEEFVPEFATKNGLSEAKVKNLLAILSHPEKVGIFNLERKLLLNICLYVLGNKNFKKDVLEKKSAGTLKDAQMVKLVEKYRNKFFWVKTDFYTATKITPQVLLEDIRKEIAVKNAQQIKAELQKMSSNITVLQEEKKQVIARLKTNKKDKRVFELLKSAIVWHDKRKEDMMKQFYYLFSAIKNLSIVTGIDRDYFYSFTLAELESYLETGFLPKKKPQTIFIAYKKGKKSEYFYGTIADKLLRAALKIGKKKKLSGIIASKGNDGKIQGRVRIITDPRNNEFKNGEILVTSMTRVEFVPLMRKAKAVITDEGGLACHAAIISRELGIPCIIGTKIATKILKNGDLVEVDADKGIVKILKKGLK